MHNDKVLVSSLAEKEWETVTSYPSGKFVTFEQNNQISNFKKWAVRGRPQPIVITDQLLRVSFFNLLIPPPTVRPLATSVNMSI